MLNPEDIDQALEVLMGEAAHAAYKKRYATLMHAHLADGVVLPLGMDLFWAEWDDSPARTIDIAPLIREQLAPDREAGYEGWPCIKARRDLLAQLVEEMDAWDAASRA